MTDHVSPRRRREVIDALRRGTVPANGLDLLAVGLERFTPVLDADLDAVAGGGSAFKAVRGEYGAGKTSYWLRAPSSWLWRCAGAARCAAALLSRLLSDGYNAVTPAPGHEPPEGHCGAVLGVLQGLVHDGAVAACDLGLVEGGVGGEQRFLVRLRARVEERAADADGGRNPVGAGGV